MHSRSCNITSFSSQLPDPKFAYIFIPCKRKRGRSSYCKQFEQDTCATIPDALVDSLVISGNEATVAERFTELLAAGLDELMVALVPTKDAGEDDEQSQLMHLIGRL